MRSTTNSFVVARVQSTLSIMLHPRLPGLSLEQKKPASTLKKLDGSIRGPFIDSKRASFKKGLLMSSVVSRLLREFSSVPARF
mmetsp:Transcript_28441/g.45683  ORF Transcript_28441/g.45683 Transcript_28441/m.45683 type:complete len:83 (-) Transcript_28441:4-252(-)